MKMVFKKNQIIISALAIMIAVAGYLNLTKDKADGLLTDADSAWDASMDQADGSDGGSGSVDEDALSELEFSDISDEDNAFLDNAFMLNDNGELVLRENEQASAGTDGVLDTDTENRTDTETPGEAVLASTTLNSGFFANAKLAREQTRSKNKQALMEIVADATLTDDQKQSAIDGILEMTEIATKENAAELLLEAKGFEGVVVNIMDGNVDVVVNSEYITDAQIAQIEDIVVRKTNITVDNIVITSVIVEE